MNDMARTSGSVVFQSPSNGAPVTRACCLSCVRELSKSVQVLLNGIEAVMVLTLIILK